MSCCWRRVIRSWSPTASARACSGSDPSHTFAVRRVPVSAYCVHLLPGTHLCPWDSTPPRTNSIQIVHEYRWFSLAASPGCGER